jgi:hypothetical protein
LENIYNSHYKLKVIDATCGKGKTSWAIQYMNEAPKDKLFIYITPFLTEVERIKKSVTSRKMNEPLANKNESKKECLRRLVKNGSNIVSTHALFKFIDDEMIAFFLTFEYELIIDECLNVIEQIPIKKNDIKILLDAKNDTGLPIITVNERGYVTWNYDSYCGDRYKDIRNLAKSKNLLIYDDIAMYWTFPVRIFSAFDQIYILTYMFFGQLQRCYFDLYKIKYHYYSVARNSQDKYELIDYIRPSQENNAQLKKMISIYEKSETDKKDLNEIGDTQNAFSSTWLKKSNKDLDLIKTIRNNAYNFHYNKCQTKSTEVMWTCVKEFKEMLTVPKVKKQFVNVTSRATNDYIDRITLIYLANRYLNPITNRFFTSQGVKVDQDLWALSELIQWIFRSGIRNNQKINLYIPSLRMRNLLLKYLNGELVASFEKIIILIGGNEPPKVVWKKG